MYTALMDRHFVETGAIETIAEVPLKESIGWFAGTSRLDTAVVYGERLIVAFKHLHASLCHMYPACT
jgi:hypothetical protein